MSFVPDIPGYQPLNAQAGPMRNFYHPACGGSTPMPAYVLAQMAADPFALGDKVTCAGCGRQVPESDVYWSDSSESLSEYRQGLKNQFVQLHKLNPADFEWGGQGPAKRKSGPGILTALVAGSLALGLVVVFFGGIGLLILGAMIGDDPPPRKAQVRPPMQPHFVRENRPWTPPQHPGMNAAHEAMQRHQQEMERMREESRKQMDKMHQEMQSRMEENMQRLRQIPPGP